MPTQQFQLALFKNRISYSSKLVLVHCLCRRQVIKLTFPMTTLATEMGNPPQVISKSSADRPPSNEIGNSSKINSSSICYGYKMKLKRYSKWSTIILFIPADPLQQE